MTESLVVIRTVEELQALESIVDTMEDFVAYDTETTGLDWGCQVIGLSICGDLEEAYYVILSYWDKEKQQLIDLDTKARIKPLLEKLKTKQLIMHNAVFDCRVTETNFGVDLMPSVHTDTVALAHLLDEKRHNGLKELSVSLFGEDSRQEQIEMKASVTENGGQLTKACYELYKADADLLGKYGAKDTILTLKLFYTLVPQLYEQGLDKFFYEEESMPLMRSATYQLNTAGLKISLERLQQVKSEVQVEMQQAKAFIHEEIAAYIKEAYPGTGKTNTFNIGSGPQISWLLFHKLDNEFVVLTDAGRAVCHFLGMSLPYTKGAKYQFIQACIDAKGQVYAPAGTYNRKTKKTSKRDAKIKDYWNYLKCGKDTLGKYSKKYKWVESLLSYKKSDKLLSTYIEGIESRMRYGIIRPEFEQTGTTSGRYSCKNPNFQNLPRDDKRIKSCIVPRPGKVFVGADQSQLEPRVFASLSGDLTLQGGFKKGEDFYSVVGAPVFGKEELSRFKNDAESFAKKFPELRDKSKVIALAIPYGRVALQLAAALGVSQDEAQSIIDTYFEKYESVHNFMLDQHEKVKRQGVVYSLFGRPRRIPEALEIGPLYGWNTKHAQLPYEARNLLNLAMNHPIQSTAASIMNRVAIHFCAKNIPGCKIISQIHDEIIVECNEQDAEYVAQELRDSMENAVTLPGVALIAEPKIAYNMADLK